MSFNGSGTFQINSAGQPVVSGTVISSTAFNALTADLATGLSTCITKDGQTTVTANIPMGNNKITGLAVGTAATDAANLSQVQSTAAKLINSVSGADTVTGVLSPTLGAYAAGQMFYWVAAGDNTGAVTLNIDSLGAKSVTRDGSVALAAGDIKSGEVVVVVYDGTRFQVVSQLNSSGDARFANVSIASTLYVGGVATFTSGTAAAPAITTAGDTNTGIFFPAADTIAFAEGGVEAARFDSSGNMGLGVTPAAWQTNSAIQLADSQSYSRYGMVRNAYFDGAAYRYVTSAPASLYQQSSNEHIWYRAASGTAGNTISFTQAMTLDASGRLALGSASILGTSNRASFVNDTSAKGVLALQNTSTSGYSAIELYDNGGTQQGAMGWGNSAVAVTGAQSATYLYSTGPITFLAGGTTERARITNSGNLLVGTTTDNGVRADFLTSGNTEVRISTSTNSPGQTNTLRFSSTASSSSFAGGGAYIQSIQGSGIDIYSLAFGTASSSAIATERARILSDGSLCVGQTTVPTNGASGSGTGSFSGVINCDGLRSHSGSGGAYQANNINFQWNGSAVRLWVDTTDLGSISVSSDYRVKKNIITQTQNALDRINKLRPVVYELADYGDLYKADGVVREGFIAHEVQEVIPSGAEGEKDEENRIQNLRLDAILSVAVKAIQEQQAMIEELKAKVAALESA